MSFFDSIMQSMYGAFRQGAHHYCHLETADDKYSFVNKDGGIVSVIELNGAYSMVGAQEFNARIDSIYAQLKGLLAKPGYKIEVVYVRDTESSEREVMEAISPSVDTVQRLRLAFKDALIERKNLMVKSVAREVCYVTITTNPTVLPPAVAKRALQSRVEFAKKNQVPLKAGAFSQSPLLAVKEIRQSHSTFVEKIISIMERLVSIRLLEVHDALRAVRMEIDPEFTSTSWSPSLPGDRIPIRLLKESGERDISHLQWPDIGWQVFPRDMELSPENDTIIKIGNRYSAPLMVDVAPQDPKPFSELFNSIGSEIPWRWSMTIETGHQQVLGKINSKKAFATMLAFAGHGNRLIKAGAEDLIQESNAGYVLADCCMSLCTWADSAEEADRRRNILSQAVQSWGYTDVVIEKGDPFRSFVNTIPAISKRSISTHFPVNLMDALAFLPITRPASPWKSGSILFRSIDNKLYPFQPGSSRQSMWIDLVFARPGSGKSVLLSALNTALITNSGNTMLPRIGIIDIGPSSASFCDMVSDMLPPSERYQVAHYRLRMTREYAINPFDTPLGCRYPLALDRQFLINFMTLLLTPIGSNTLANTAEISSQLVESMYSFFDRSPRRYERHVDKKVDDALDAYNIEVESDSSWWEVVDKLFEKGVYHEASLAQRYAVPTLGDATMILNQDLTIKDMYREATIQGSGEGVVAACGRMLSSVIKDYPILASPSMFDLSGARIVALDLAEVAKTGGDAADRQTAVMYMLSRYALCREYYRDLESLSEMPPNYREYHKKLIEVEMQSAKKICFDEFHRTFKSPKVRDQVVVDMREGRKFNVHIALVSQREQDFDSDMVDLATNVFILDRGTEQTRKSIKDIFSPPDDVMRALNTYVRGPGPEGGNILYIGNIKGGEDINQILKFQIGPQELWAYSTTVEDVAIRRRLSERFGLSKALKILAKKFPGGSAKRELERRKVELSKRVGEVGNEDVMERVADILVDEIISQYSS